ncbi:hypothetical protein BJ170DRAFT_608209 [Xylariales sp. AK1849]|nr:hypothetical protein BJ170DRAFT_608209 [Xylariales sp. AK1849]
MTFLWILAIVLSGFAGVLEAKIRISHDPGYWAQATRGYLFPVGWWDHTGNVSVDLMIQTPGGLERARSLAQGTVHTPTASTAYIATSTEYAKGRTYGGPSGYHRTIFLTPRTWSGCPIQTVKTFRRPSRFKTKSCWQLTGI